MRIIFWAIALYTLIFFAHAEEIRFGKREISLGLVTLQVEIAETEQEQMRGLMYRRSLSDSRGMLFVYRTEETRVFWMKNTFIPLSIGFFNKNRELIDVQDMQPVTSEMQVKVPSYKSAGPAMYALEVPQGWFKRHKVPLRTKFNFTQKLQ